MTAKTAGSSTAKTISQNLNRNVSVYATVAAAAGVGVLALAQPANAEVVITKKTIPIPITPEGQTLVPISLSNNGVNDFSFSLYSFAYHSAFRSLRIRDLEGGAVVAHTSAGHVPSALALVRGAKIGPSAHFSSGKSAAIEDSHANFGYTNSGKFFYSKDIFGKWGNNPKDRYLGVRFLISGQTHYGWIRLTVTTAAHEPISATITAYAYETVANKRILAGESGASTSAATVENKMEQPAQASLGMLALGTNGLALWRREEVSAVHF